MGPDPELPQDAGESSHQQKALPAMRLSASEPIHSTLPALRRRLTAVRVEPAAPACAGLPKTAAGRNRPPARALHPHYQTGSDSGHYAANAGSRALPLHRGRIVDIFV
jgi:hypothetical protein